MSTAQRFLFIVIFSLGSLSSWGSTRQTTCEQALTATADKLTATINKLQTTIHNIQSKLGLSRNPMAGFAVTDPQSANALWHALLNANSPLKDVFSLHHNSFFGTAQDIQWDVLTAIADRSLEYSQIKKQTVFNIAEFQAHLLAASLALDYTLSFRPATTDHKDSEKKDESKEQKEEEKENSTPQPLAPYPNFSDIYPPHDIDESSESSAKKGAAVVFQQMNFEIPLLMSKVYSILRRDPENQTVYVATANLFSPPALDRSGHSDKFATIFPNGKTEFEPLIPDGYRPIQPLDPRVSVIANPHGYYEIKTTQPLEQINLPLVKKNIWGPPNPMQRDILTQTMGVQLNEWPETTQSVIKKFSLVQGSEESFANAIDLHLRRDFLYNRKTKANLDPTVAMKKGEMACFHASLAMAEMLRSKKIPAVIVAGYRAQRWIRDNGKEWSYVTDQAEGHAYVVTFVGGRWKTYDPTPEKISPNSPQDQKPSEYSTIPHNKNTENQKSQQGKEAQSSQGQGAGGEDLIDKITKDILERQEKNKAAGNEAGKDSSAENGDKGKPDQPLTYTQEDLIKELNVGSLTADKEEKTNPFISRVQRLITRYFLAPSQSGQVLNEWFVHIKSMLNKYKNAELSRMLSEYEKALNGHRPDMPSWISQIVEDFDDMPINDSYRHFSHFAQQFEIFARTLDGPVRQQASAVLRELRSIQQAYTALAHANAKELALAEKLLTDLPPFAAQTIMRRYGVSAIGMNGPSMALAKDLKDGKLNTERLMAMLTPLTDFIMDGKPQPTLDYMKVWERDPMRPYGREQMPVTRRQDWLRARRQQTHLSKRENYIQGTLVANQTRREILVESDEGEDQTERVTYALLDGSGSMTNIFEFLKGLIKTFAARCASDTTDSDNPRLRHRLIIVPFNTNLLVEQKILLMAQSEIEDLMNDRIKIEFPDGGTDIESVLIQVLAQIAADEKASDRNGKILVGANVLLISDGESPVDYTKVKTARAAVSQENFVQFMFVSLTGHNPALEKLAGDSRQMGADTGYYRDFTSQDIQQYLSASQTTSELKEGEYFFSDKQPSDLSSDIRNRIARLPTVFAEFETAYRQKESLQLTTITQLIQKVKMIQPRLEEADEKFVYTSIQNLRGFLVPSYRVLAEHRGARHGSWSNRIAYDLIANFSKLSQQELNTLTVKEQQALLWLLEDLRKNGGS